MTQGGDALARGAKSATFGPAKVSQKKRDDIFGEYEPKIVAEKPITKDSSAFEKAARTGKK